MSKRVVELFAGIGGFRIGLQNTALGYDFVWANQWEPKTKAQYASDIYSSHFGRVSNKDINQVDKYLIPDMDLLTAGFPCQDYSVANHSAYGSHGIEGKKGVLWWAIRDTLYTKRPPFVLLENVDRLLTSPGKQRGRDFGIILYTLNELGYDVQWQVVNSADYGFPQRRRRTYIIAYRRNTKYAQQLKQDPSYPSLDTLINQGIINQTLPISMGIKNSHLVDMTPYKSVVAVSNKFSAHFGNIGVASQGLVHTGTYKAKYTDWTKHLGDILLPSVDDERLFLTPEKIQRFQYLKGAKSGDHTTKAGHSYHYREGAMAFPDPLDRPSRTILTSERMLNRSTHVVEDLETHRLRYLAPVEVERLQGFPDNWTQGVKESARYFTLGNALVTGVVEKIGESLGPWLDQEH